MNRLRVEFRITKRWFRKVRLRGPAGVPGVDGGRFARHALQIAGADIRIGRASPRMTGAAKEWKRPRFRPDPGSPVMTRTNKTNTTRKPRQTSTLS